MLRFNVINRPTRLQRLALAPVIGLAVTLGGCSADFLRFDSPVFGLNGDKSAVENSASTAPDATLYDQRTASAPLDNGSEYSDNYTSAPVSNVSRSTPPPVNYRSEPKRVARAAPIIEAPTPSSSSPYAPLTTGALRSHESITVQAGDTLYQLSRRHGVSVAAIRQANGLTGNTIKPGQKLMLPGSGTAPASPTTQYRNSVAAAPQASRPVPDSAGNTYTVRRGDSLYAISRRTGVSVSELKRLNGIGDVRSLRPGTRLTLGGDAAAPSTQVASRTSVTPRSQIRAKSIKTMPIVRAPVVKANAPPAASVNQPRILNQRPSTPIATKPNQRVAAATPTEPVQKFRWPARGRIIAEFNHSGQGTKNDGINIALPMGTDIAAAESGVVAYSGSELKGYGNLVLVRHDNGWVSAYAHASEILVKRGDRITRGQIIAKAGRSGGVTQPQLHFELRKGAKPVDPMPHLAQL